ncbi:hypothetical protein HOC99_04740 [Candidatus Woesearchaeota archaeon]|jgi:hypothetical protein|nr:hypothetical protein [Candidatus Woesearchaeota archaeon]MBT4387208.1 hypothetical protein [Candidatus Woesearchaeota archaeon]MBT4596210.1 hypothetical protein [Candidatus Woesearchaeota archaeon]MBT5741567.1 hypothetical protein [Candidatus Woesearchaeota archaeon]MBT7849347.1 hypothetical protein [Candidatus Woesearchaeota archaeon]
MKILNILLIVLIGLLLTACGETIENKNNGENNNINNNESKNNILLTIEDEKEMVKQNMFDLLEENNNMLIRDISGKLILRCNLLDCGISSKVEHDELFSGSSPEVEIMTHITFNKIIENQNSLDAYNQNIKNVNLNLYFPEQKSENIRVQTSFYDLKDNLRFTSFENGVLKGSLEFDIETLTLYIQDSKDDSCITGDMMGICYEDFPITGKYKLNIEFKELELN